MPHAGVGRAGNRSGCVRTYCGTEQALREQAAYVSGWDNFETARQLRQEADMLDVSSVHAVWQNHPHVAEALRNISIRPRVWTKPKIMEGMEF